MKSQTVLVALCSLLISVNAQSQDNYKFPGENKYPKAKIYLNDYENTVFIVRNLNINNDHLVYEQEKTNTMLQTASEADLTDVYSIKLPAGSFWKEGALGGLVIGLYASLDTASKEKQKESTDPNYESKAGAGLYIGATVGCTVVCALIMHSTKKWKTLYLNEEVSISEQVKFKYNICYNPVQQSSFITLNLSY